VSACGPAVQHLPPVEADAAVERLQALKSKLSPDELAWRERIAKLELSDYSGFSPNQVLGEAALLGVLQPHQSPAEIATAQPAASAGAAPTAPKHCADPSP